LGNIKSMLASDEIWIYERIEDEGDPETKKALKELLDKRQKYQKQCIKIVDNERKHLNKQIPSEQVQAQETLNRNVNIQSIKSRVKNKVKSNIENVDLVNENIVLTYNEFHKNSDKSTPREILLPVQEFFGLIVVSFVFKHLPPIHESAKVKAFELYEILMDSKLAGFNKQGCKLLVNPSVVEFNDAISTLKTLCTENSTFFACIVV